MEWAGGLKFSSPLSLYCCISFLSICLILSSWFRYRGAWRISLPARGVNRRWFSKIQISRYFKSRTFFPMATGILRIPLEPVYADGLSETVLIFSIISSSQHIVRNPYTVVIFLAYLGWKRNCLFTIIKLPSLELQVYRCPSRICCTFWASDPIFPLLYYVLCCTVPQIRDWT